MLNFVVQWWQHCDGAVLHCAHARVVTIAIEWSGQCVIGDVLKNGDAKIDKWCGFVEQLLAWPWP